MHAGAGNIILHDRHLLSRHFLRPLADSSKSSFQPASRRLRAAVINVAPTMVSIVSKALSLIFLFAATVSVAQLPPWECPATESNHLCCVAFGDFGDLGDHCGIQGVDPSTPTASGFCTSAYNPCLQGSVAACCESVLPCGNGMDGPIGVNCTRVEY